VDPNVAGEKSARGKTAMLSRKAYACGHGEDALVSPGEKPRVEYETVGTKPVLTAFLIRSLRLRVSLASTVSRHRQKPLSLGARRADEGGTFDPRDERLSRPRSPVVAQCETPQPDAR